MGLTGAAVGRRPMPRAAPTQAGTRPTPRESPPYAGRLRREVAPRYRIVDMLKPLWLPVAGPLTCGLRVVETFGPLSTTWRCPPRPAATGAVGVHPDAGHAARVPDHHRDVRLHPLRRERTAREAAMPEPHDRVRPAPRSKVRMNTSVASSSTSLSARTKETFAPIGKISGVLATRRPVATSSASSSGCLQQRLPHLHWLLCPHDRASASNEDGRGDPRGRRGLLCPHDRASASNWPARWPAAWSAGCYALMIGRRPRTQGNLQRTRRYMWRLLCPHDRALASNEVDIAWAELVVVAMPS
jgi:hypothetical protein